MNTDQRPRAVGLCSAWRVAPERASAYLPKIPLEADLASHRKKGTPPGAFRRVASKKHNEFSFPGAAKISELTRLTVASHHCGEPPRIGTLAAAEVDHVQPRQANRLAPAKPKVNGLVRLSTMATLNSASEHCCSLVASITKRL